MPETEAIHLSNLERAELRDAARPEGTSPIGRPGIHAAHFRLHQQGLIELRPPAGEDPSVSSLRYFATAAGRKWLATDDAINKEKSAP